MLPLLEKKCNTGSAVLCLCTFIIHQHPVKVKWNVYWSPYRKTVLWCISYLQWAWNMDKFYPTPLQMSTGIKRNWNLNRHISFSWSLYQSSTAKEALLSSRSFIVITVSKCMWLYVCVYVCINFQHLRIHKYTYTLSILHNFIFYCNILGYERKFILQLYNYQEEFILNDTFASCNNIYTI